MAGGRRGVGARGQPRPRWRKRGGERMNRDGLDGLDGLGGGFDDAGRMAGAFEAELARLREQMLYTSREVGVLSSGIGGGLRRAFDGLVFDGMKLSDALKGVARAMV